MCKKCDISQLCFIVICDLSVMNFPIKCSNPMLAGTPNFWQIASKLCQKTVQGPPTTIFVTITYFTYTMSRIILILCKFGLTMMAKKAKAKREKYETNLLHRIFSNFMFFFFSQMSAAIWLISLILPKLKIYF